MTQLAVGLDIAHEDKIGSFWSVLLTGSPKNKVSDSIFDPSNRVPAIWFQATGVHDTPRQRWHFDVGSHPKLPTCGSLQPCQRADPSSIRLEHHPSPFSRIPTAIGCAFVAPPDANLPPIGVLVRF